MPVLWKGADAWEYEGGEIVEPCRVDIRVFDKGRPAAYCVLDVFEKHRVLWWEFETWITGARTGVDGKMSVTLTKGSTYRFKFVYLRQEKNERVYLTSCPWKMDVNY